MLKWVFGNRKKKSKGEKNTTRKAPSYEDAKKIARSEDAGARRNLASYEDLEPELLYYFASDKSPEVRRAIAENTGTPLQADTILARDGNEDVRCELAFKIGRMVPSLGKDENERLASMAMEILNVLARDELPRVRAIVSEEIKHATNVPNDIVRLLARDVEEIVAAPILEYSPLLSDQDLLDIISGGIGETALKALSRRRNMMEPVVDAIVEVRNTEALGILLGNKSAQIREETLDTIAIVATGAAELHKPMVDRDNLPLRTIRRIASFISASLLETLIERNNIAPEVVDDLRMSVRRRIDREDDFAGRQEIATKPEKDAKECDDATIIPASERAERSFSEGKLNDEVICRAIDEKDYTFVRHALSLMSGLDMRVVAKMLNTGSGKGATTLAWKAGLNMQTAVRLQLSLAKIKPKGLVEPLADGSCPMSKEDLEWYVEYYSA